MVPGSGGTIGWINLKILGNLPSQTKCLTRVAKAA